ncbi:MULTISPECIES: hypothetical protein [unclassified Kitasatospora]|uniref:hypothetical protein n=1 Tax=unclassified Kitasatospora TaxID=2633591 RepID=UPI000A8D78DA|nr:MULTISPECIES: hypothetical protein [unclassified Kitasatospora]
MEWIDPRYAELVAEFRKPLDPQQLTFDRPMPPEGAPANAVRGFVMERLDD